MIRNRMGVLVPDTPVMRNLVTRVPNETPIPADVKVVDMGLPSGTKWAECDIDLTKPNKFCDTPFTYEKSFFSWGNIDGHNPTSVSSFAPMDWGNINAQEPWYDGQVYGGTHGCTLTGDIPVCKEFDAVRANLGAPWRTPTAANFTELLTGTIFINHTGTEIPAETIDKRVFVNGIMGIYLQSKTNGKRLFLSASGYGIDMLWNSRGTNGAYLTSSFVSSSDSMMLNLYSGGEGPNINESGRFIGCSIRPVIIR